MIIVDARMIRPRDVASYAWLRISQFHNVDHTANLIKSLHGVPVSQSRNVKRQAEQIKFCLVQAREYAQAATAVTLATKPVLLYYSAMSLALAQILFKQTAESRLAVLRKEHNCHGLTFVVKADPNPDEPLRVAASKLVAKPQTDSHGSPRGTFEVWRRSAREYPVAGYFTTHFDNGTSTKGFRALLIPAEVSPGKIPDSGLSLGSCVANLPYMSDVLARLGLDLEMVRTTVSMEQRRGLSFPTLTVALHPTSQAKLDSFGALLKVPPAAVNYLNCVELPGGYIYRHVLDPDLPGVGTWPDAVCLTDEQVYMSCSEMNLGEFGYLYVALHLSGNFARYYPDLWLKHIAHSSALSLAIDELCNHSLERLPLLSLSELERVYYVVGD
jgi:hypothetical protein